MKKETTYTHWHLQTDDQSVLWLMLDKQNAAVNTLDESVFSEFEKILDTIEAQKNLRGVVIGSKKSSGFIAGAAIEQFTQLHSIDAAKQLIERGQDLFNRLANLSLPTVAMIDGFCLGGGLELVLACRYRVAEDSKNTRLGLPEVLLGIHPGWGGTVRLPRLVGAVHAMDLILSGRMIDAKTAAAMGVVDVAVPKRQLERAARYYATQKPPIHRANLLQRITQLPPLRPLLGEIFRKKLEKKVSRAHYPAPYAVVDNWIRYDVNTTEAYAAEANSVAQLQANETAKNLMRVFFLRERLKSQAKQVDFEPKYIHVIGAGVMGGDIAAWCALRGFHVTLQDREPKFIAPAIKRAFALFQKKLKQPHLIRAAMDRLIPDPQGQGIAKADLIIEAIFENTAAKQALFKQLESQAKPDAILATNTSSIPLDEIGSVLEKPERLIGIHFFNPVAQMQLVEIVHGKKTQVDIIQKALLFTKKLDRLPLLVKSSPGFLVNRVLMAYLLESFAVLHEGTPAAVIDQAAIQFGMPMGPIELADTVGLDICLSVATNLSAHYGGVVPDQLRELVQAGQLGRKSGQGFYTYKKGKALKDPCTETSEVLKAIAQRIIAHFIEETEACVQENIVADADLADAGMIFGTGFAPFRGGPLHYAQSLK